MWQVSGAHGDIDPKAAVKNMLSYHEVPPPPILLPPPSPPSSTTSFSSFYHLVDNYITIILSTE